MLAARRALDDWLAYASRSKLAPFVKLARTIRSYRPSIEATIEWKLTNGIAESNNAAIGRIRANARGFHDPHAFITMIMLDRAGIGPHLPWATSHDPRIRQLSPFLGERRRLCCRRQQAWTVSDRDRHARRRRHSRAAPASASLPT